MADRAVSTVVSYVLVLGIVALLVTTLLTTFAPFVTNQQQSTAQSTMSVFGNDIAGDLGSADRLATRIDENGRVELRTSLPNRVGGSRYEIEIVNETDTGRFAYEIVLTANDFEASAIVHVRTAHPVETRTGSQALDGGPLKLAYDTDADTLVITNV